MNVVVAAPTAGSCGAVFGTLLACAKDSNKNKDDIHKVNTVLEKKIQKVWKKKYPSVKLTF